MKANDLRANAPIATPAEVHELVGMPLSTVYSWMRPTRTRPALIHSVTPAVRGWPSIPLIGIAEASVLRAMRDRGMKMPEIAASVDYLREKHGQYALGAPELVTDGVSTLIRGEAGDVQALVTGDWVLLDVVKEYLHPFTLAPDGFVQSFLVRRLPGVAMDPRFSSGRMRFTRTGVPLFAVAGLLDVGEAPEVVADEFELEQREVELVREHLPWVSRVA